MIEVKGDLFEQECDALVITTNGTVRKDGACVMGRGVALQAKQKWPGVEYELGRLIGRNGNIVQVIAKGQLAPLVALPVKHHWHQKADLDLIRRSCMALALMARTQGWQKVVLPRPGCGNGSLDWRDVRIVVEYILHEDRFVVVNNE